jgi:hypothetical protein
MLNSLRHPPSTERRLKKKPKNNSDSETTVRRRCISTWSSSATSTAENPPPPVSRPSVPSLFPHILIIIGHLIYKCGGIDKRTIEKFEKVCSQFNLILNCPPSHHPRYRSCFGGGGAQIFKKAERLVAAKIIDVDIGFDPCMRRSIAIAPAPHISSGGKLTMYHRKRPSWARVLSSTLGSWTS